MTYKLPEPSSDLVCSPNHVRAAFAAWLAHRRKVPEGWKLVPIEPTRETTLSEKDIAALSEWATKLTVAPEPKP